MRSLTAGCRGPCGGVDGVVRAVTSGADITPGPSTWVSVLFEDRREWRINVFKHTLDGTGLIHQESTRAWNYLISKLVLKSVIKSLLSPSSFNLYKHYT